MKKAYRNTRITVYWEPEKCIHSTMCIMQLPLVFDPARRPWIDINAAEAGDIKRAIDKCPSGALTCKLHK